MWTWFRDWWRGDEDPTIILTDQSENTIQAHFPQAEHTMIWGSTEQDPQLEDLDHTTVATGTPDVVFEPESADAPTVYWSSSLATEAPGVPPPQALDATADLPPAPRLDGVAFTLHEKLGQGGAAAVYRATADLGHGNQTVAVKIIDASWAEQLQEHHDLMREAQLMCHLDHPNLVKGLGVTTLSIDGKDHLAIVTEYLAGVSLERIIKKHPDRPLSDREALQVTAEAGAALDYLHEQGFVHGDVKPGNLLVSETGQVKVLDLGTAVPLDPLAEHDLFLGSTGYTAPERLGTELRGRPANLGDPASDTFSLAASVLHAATNTRLHPTGTIQRHPKSVLFLLRPAHEWNQRLGTFLDRDADRWTYNGLRRSLEQALQHDPTHRPTLWELVDCAVERLPDAAGSSLAERVQNTPAPSWRNDRLADRTLVGRPERSPERLPSPEPEIEHRLPDFDLDIDL